MGILSRFRDVMKVNVNALLDRSEDPEQTIDQYMRSLHSDLGKVKAETASVLANERRAKRALDESSADISKFQRYAEKSVEAGNEADALKFLERKAAQTEKHKELKSAYDQAAANAVNMKQMQDKLVSDMDKLSARHTELKARMAKAKAQEQMNGNGTSSGGTAFKKMEEKADLAIYEAEALAELRGGEQKDDFDELFAEWEKGKSTVDAEDDTAPPSAEDELAALKDKMKKKE
ncbi:PspA/IM30 family protein [Paenibacillus sp. JCM 10914]|uniref:PspA/IM30 family protein n=1 Tax=Paenibacillus sp. JCM 10914 TaxID=1236974 RepID=UPI0003CC82FC|nr:PspA/IM30 family protein [Paenibacillus sp. JCM 10914]GAE05926.1 phage shock protein A [Paenibacillus sp. JCM 10914]